MKPGMDSEGIQETEVTERSMRIWGSLSSWFFFTPLPSRLGLEEHDVSGGAPRMEGMLAPAPVVVPACSRLHPGRPQAAGMRIRSIRVALADDAIIVRHVRPAASLPPAREGRKVAALKSPAAG
jgi:hypothetical protein